MVSVTRISTAVVTLGVSAAFAGPANAAEPPGSAPRWTPSGALRFPTITIDTSPVPPQCHIFPILCGSKGRDSSGPKPGEIFEDVIVESFEKVGIDPAQAGTTGTLATVDIGGVRGDVQASETGEVTTQIKELPETTTAGKQGAQDADTETAESETTTAPEVAPEDGEPPAAPESEAAPTPPEEAPPSAPTPEPPPAPEQQAP